MTFCRVRSFDLSVTRSLSVISSSLASELRFDLLVLPAHRPFSAAAAGSFLFPATRVLACYSRIIRVLFACSRYSRIFACFRVFSRFRDSTDILSYFDGFCPFPHALCGFLVSFYCSLALPTVDVLRTIVYLSSVRLLLDSLIFWMNDLMNRFVVFVKLSHTHFYLRSLTI